MTVASTEYDSADSLNALVDECRTLCANADLAIASLGPERESFLARSLEDALRQVGMILRVVGEEARGTEEQESAGFLRRLKRGIARKPEREEHDVAASEILDGEYVKQGLQGNSWTISLPELLGFLSSACKTGVLWIDTPTENYVIGLSNGHLVHATSDSTPEGLRLGEVLVGLGFLTRRQLERFLESQTDDSWFSGESLFESGMISPEELHTALVYQVQQLFHRIMDVRRALFRFREGLEIVQAHPVRLNVTQLLLESARVRDEMKQSGLLAALVGNSAPVTMIDPLEDWNAWQDQLASIEVRTDEPRVSETPSGPSASCTAPQTTDSTDGTGCTDGTDDATPAGPQAATSETEETTEAVR